MDEMKSIAILSVPSENAFEKIINLEKDIL